MCKQQSVYLNCWLDAVFNKLLFVSFQNVSTFNLCLNNRLYIHFISLNIPFKRHTQTSDIEVIVYIIFMQISTKVFKYCLKCIYIFLQHFIPFLCFEVHFQINDSTLFSSDEQSIKNALIFKRN